MNVTIKCFASLSRFTPPDADAHPVEPGLTVDGLIARLAIPPQEIKLVFVNGAHVEGGAVLQDGDRVGLFPAVGGG